MCLEDIHHHASITHQRIERELIDALCEVAGRRAKSVHIGPGTYLFRDDAESDGATSRLDLDSLESLNLIVSLEDRLDITLPYTAAIVGWANIHTVNDVVNFLLGYLRVAEDKGSSSARWNGTAD